MYVHLEMKFTTDVLNEQEKYTNNKYYMYFRIHDKCNDIIMNICEYLSENIATFI